MQSDVKLIYREVLLSTCTSFVNSHELLLGEMNSVDVTKDFCLAVWLYHCSKRWLYMICVLHMLYSLLKKHYNAYRDTPQWHEPHAIVDSFLLAFHFLKFSCNNKKHIASFSFYIRSQFQTCISICNMTSGESISVFCLPHYCHGIQFTVNPLYLTNSAFLT